MYLYQIVKRKNAQAEQIAEYIYRIGHLSILGSMTNDYFLRVRQ